MCCCRRQSLSCLPDEPRRGRRAPSADPPWLEAAQGDQPCRVWAWGNSLTSKLRDQDKASGARTRRITLIASTRQHGRPTRASRLARVGTPATVSSTRLLEDCAMLLHPIFESLNSLRDLLVIQSNSTKVDHSWQNGSNHDCSNRPS